MGKTLRKNDIPVVAFAGNMDAIVQNIGNTACGKVLTLRDVVIFSKAGLGDIKAVPENLAIRIIGIRPVKIIGLYVLDSFIDDVNVGERLGRIGTSSIYVMSHSAPAIPKDGFHVENVSDDGVLIH